jgi:23S rRNA (uracil1939-C5)-methyltransferase
VTEKKLTVGQQVDGKINSLAFGGAGILRWEGQVIFVPFTAPEDLVRIKITKAKQNHAWGELVTLLQPGPDRQHPRCPYFGRCGGCQLQHINSDAQEASKRESIISA